MGAFDDLTPKSSGAFDDLVPAAKKEQQPKIDLTAPVGSEGFMGGVADLARQSAKGIISGIPEFLGKSIDFAADRPTEIGGAITEFGKKMDKATPGLNTSIIGQRESADPWSIRGAAGKAGESMALSFGPMLAGAGGGALIGAAGGPIGAAGGAAIGALSALPLFYGSQAYDTQKKVEEAQLKAGATPEVAHAEARKAGHLSGSIEAGGEFLSDIIPLGKMFKPLAAAGKDAVGTAVRSLFGGQLKKAAGTVAKTEVGEIATEMGQQAGQAAVEGAYGAGEGATWDDTAQVIMPTAIMSLFPGGLAAAHNFRHTSQVKAALTNAEADPEQRAAAASAVFTQLQGANPQTAQAFALYARDQIATGQPIEIADDSFYADWVTEKNAPPAPAPLALPRPGDVPLPMGEGNVGPISTLRQYQQDAAQAHADAVYQARDDFEQAQGIRQELMDEDAQRAADRAFLTQSINGQIAADAQGAEEQAAAIELARQGALPSRQMGLDPRIGPITAMAANAVDSGATGAQTAQRSGPLTQLTVEAQQQEAAQQDGASPTTAPVGDNSAATAAQPPTTPAPDDRVIKGTSEPAPQAHLFPFPTAEAAQRMAIAMSQQSKVPHVAIPHPYKHDQYTVVTMEKSRELMAQQDAKPIVPPDVQPEAAPAGDAQIQRAESEQSAPVTPATAAARTHVAAELQKIKDWYQIPDIKDLAQAYEDGGNPDLIADDEDESNDDRFLHGVNVRGSLNRVRDEAAEIERLATEFPTEFAEGIERMEILGIKSRHPKSILQQMSLATEIDESKFAAHLSTPDLGGSTEAIGDNGAAPTPERLALKQNNDLQQQYLEALTAGDDARADEIAAQIDAANGKKPATIDVAAHQAATSPQNDLPEPTDAQKEAGNYQKGHHTIGGLDFSIENPQGSKRRPEWPALKHHYGYIKGTIGRDKDHLDAFINPGTPDDYDGPVFIVDQIDPKTGKFDEHKVMVGFNKTQDAEDAYFDNYERGWQGLGDIKRVEWDGFKRWLKEGNTKAPFAPQHGTPAALPLIKAEPRPYEPAAAGNPVTTTIDVDTDAIPLTMDVSDFNEITDEWAALFAPPGDGRVIMSQKVAGQALMTPEEAKAQIEKWKAHAAKQGETTANSNRWVISLFDWTGEWAKPWVDAGYNVIHLDIKDGVDINDLSVEWFSDNYPELSDVWAILAAPPCTDFANSGNRHKPLKNEDGRTAASIELVRQTLRTIEYFRPALWALENPVGSIAKMTGLPPARLTFDPNHFGDPYTKKTLIWGQFNGDLPAAPVEPTEGSKMHIKFGGKSEATKAARSVTPEGFAYAFFMANNAVDMPAEERLTRLYPMASGAIKTALKAGVPEAEVEEILDHSYDYDDGGNSREELAKAVAKLKPAAPEKDQRPAESIKRGLREAIAHAESAEFEKGDRVEITKGEHSGRHGEVERKDVMISHILNLREGHRRQERSVHYTVKTDGGVSVTAGAKELAPESAPAANVVPDVEVDGRFVEPQHAFRMIAYFKGEADKARAAALRARKRETKAAHMAQAKREDAKSETYRAAFEAWADKHPDLAREIRGDKPIEAKPAADSGGKFILTEAKHGKTGAKLWVVGMKDRVERDEYLRLNDVAKRNGGAYSKWTKGFEFTSEQQARDFMAAESGAAPTVPQEVSPPARADVAPAAVKAEDAGSVSADDFDALINEVQAERADKPAGLAKMQAAKAANEAARGPKKAIPTPQVPPIAGTAPLGVPSKARLIPTRAPNGGVSITVQPIKDAGQHAAEGVKAGFAGLDALFGRKGTLGSGPVFDEETWAKAKPHFEAAFNEFVAAGKSLKEFVRHILDVYNEAVIPYLKRWHAEKTQGANDGTRTDAVAGKEDGARSDAGEGTVDVRGAVGERETGDGAEQPGKVVLGDDGTGEHGRDVAGGVDGPGAGVRQEGGPDRAGKEGSDRVGPGDGAGLPGRTGSPDLADYRPAPGDLDRVGSWRDAASRNLDILELIHQLDSEKRAATPAEQALIAKFTGWGASELRQKLFITRQDVDTKRPVLDPENYRVDPAWKPLVERAAQIMTPEELATALASTQYAHYTSEPIVRSIWSALARMGFKGGKILEPGMGTGIFHQLAPDAIVKASRYTGIERESLTAAIARHLLPKQIVMMADYVRQKLPNGYFDVAIGNPPFAKTIITDDPAYSRYRFSLHDYFFAKTIDKVRPGGVMVFVTSRYTMDKAGDRARKYLAERADLIGAVRLPQTAFKANAGTEVVTDVLFLRKREAGELPGGAPWLELKEVEADGEKAIVNEYFADHPEMVLGKHSTKGTMYARNSYTVLPAEGAIEDLFQKAIESLPQGIYAERKDEPSARKTFERDLSPKVQKDGSLYVGDDGELYRREHGAGRRVAEFKNLPPRKLAWLKGFVKLRDLMKQARYDQLTDGDWEKSLQALNRGYSAFVKEHGPILDFSERERTDEDEDGNQIKRIYRVYNNGPLLQLDVEGPLVAALERIDSAGKVVKGNFLTGRVLRKPAPPTINSTQDALLVGLSDRGGLDLPYIAGLRGITVEQAIADLGDAIYRDPAAGWQTRDEYLSGDVIKKLEEARVAAANDSSYQRNVDALYKAQPSPLTARDVTVGIGSPWLAPSDIAQFAEEKLGIGTEPSYNSVLGVWSVPGSSSRNARAAASEWGTDRRSPYEILEAALNNKSIVIRDVDADKKTYYNAVDSAAANEKVRKVKEEFSRWIWTDAGRAERLLDEYNRRFNNIAPREFDGSFLRLPGLSMRWQESLHPHQKRAIWRMVQTGNTYLAHAVGAGKTMEMIIGAMEQRRLGLIQKPIFVVPNHMLEQFANEFLDAYPGADIMVAGDTNFVGDARRRFVAQAAANNPDAIIITHSAFGKIAPPAEATKKVLDNLVDELRTSLDELDGDDRRTRSQVEARIEQLERRFGGRTSDDKADSVVTLDEMGVDHVLVDEAHEFRKLDFVTNLNNVKGITPEGSRRALDLYIKVKALETINPGRSHTFASGTPVTNTLGELYSIMRFMDEDALNNMGLRAFDSWASQFGEVAAFDERNAAGRYEVVERFASFVNVPDLMARVRSFMDVLTSNQLSGLVKRPTVKGGEPRLVLTESSEGLRDYMKGLEERIEISRKWKPSKEQPGNPDPLINIITDGRLAAIDTRFVRPSKLDAGSKLNRMLDEIVATHQRIQDDVYTDPVSGKADAIRGGSQIVFSAVGFGDAIAANRGFDVRKFVTSRLREGGIRPEQIAWMGDYTSHAQKEAMFRDMRDGKIKVLFGSPKNMGTGLNVQRRLKALHYLAPPWYPADVEQPHGRILRQGNLNAEVEINWYATKGTYDSTQWQMIARKARFIEQAMTGDRTVRRLDDISEASQYEQASALASGDARVIQYTRLLRDIESLGNLERAHAQEQIDFRRRRDSYDYYIAANRKRKADLEKAVAAGGGTFVYSSGSSAKIDGVEHQKYGEIGSAVLAAMKRLTETWRPTKKGESISIGSLSFGGKSWPLSVQMEASEYKGNVNITARPAVTIGPLVEPGTTFVSDREYSQQERVAVGDELFSKINAISGQLRRVDEKIAADLDERAAVDRRIGAPFERKQELVTKIAEAATLRQELVATGTQDPHAGAPSDGTLNAVATPAPVEGVPPADAPKFDLGATGAGMARAEVQASVGAITAKWRRGPKVKVVQSVAELPFKAPPQARGAFWNGAVYLVADNLKTPAAAQFVLLHEAAGHFGLSAILGDQLDSLMRMIYDSNAKVREMADQRIAHAARLGKVYSPALATEEALADLAGRGEVANIRGWKLLLAKIRAALRQLGFTLEMSDADIGALLKRAREALEGPAVPAAAGARMSMPTGTFYSALQVGLQSAPFSKAHTIQPAQLKSWIAARVKDGKFKAAEVEWSGINEWIDGWAAERPNQPISKIALDFYMTENGVQVDEVMLRNVKRGRSEERIRGDVEALGYRIEEDLGAMPGEPPFVQHDATGEWIDPEDLPDDVVALVQEWMDATGDASLGVQFSKYQLPGGNNYRELLLTLPGPVRFTAGHYEQANVIAHVRFNERTDAEGRKVLFLEELQSDWAQQGRDRGFRKETLPSNEELIRTGQWVPQDNKLTAAPFVTDTKAWVALAMKRMVRYAAENGFDAIAWTNGEQQAGRYALEKHIDAIGADAQDEDGMRTVVIIPKGAPRIEMEINRDGKIVNTRDYAMRGKTLDEALGKDIAKRILGDPKSVTLVGLDLKVGGEGMKSFYDQIVPQVARDVVKKLGGGEVGTVTFRESRWEDTRGGLQPPIAQSGFTITPAMRDMALEGQPLFSLAGTPLGNGIEAVKESLRTPRTFNWWHRTVGTQYHKAQTVPEFRPVFDSAQRYLQDVSQLAIDAADKAPGWLPRLAKFADVFSFGPKSADLAAVSKVVFEGTLNASRPDAIALKNLSHAQRKLYTQARAAIDLSLDQVATSELYKLAGDEKIDGARRSAKDLPPRDALELLQTALTMRAEDMMTAGRSDEVERIGRVLDQMEKVVEKLDKLKAEGYAPLMRFGQYTVDVTHTEENADGKEVVVRDYFGMYETAREAAKAERMLREQFPDSTVTNGVMDDEGWKLYRGLSLDSLALFADATGLKEHHLFQDYYKLAISARSALTRLIHRKGIAGYNEDLQRVLAAFVTSNARLASRNYHFGEMTQAAVKIPNRMGDVRAEAARLVEYVQNPIEEASKLRGLLFVNFLGGSVASALTNATQPVMMTLPYLSQFKGAAKAAGALAEAAKVAAGKVPADAELRKAMTRAAKEGITDPQELHQLYAESIRGLGSSMPVRRALRVWGSMFSLAESFNRRITFVAAWNVAKGMTAAELRAAGAASPFEFAEKAVEDTQGIYNRGNRPNWARGPIGATVFTFKQYSVAYLEFLKRLPPKEKAIALSLLVLAAGLQGLPGADDLEDLIDTIGQMLGYNTNSKQAIREAAIDTLGKELGGLLMHGVSGLPGSPVDVQQRLGLSNLVPGTGMFMRSSPDKAREIAEVVGPVGGVYTQAAQGAAAAIAGQWGQVAAAATPVAVQNAMKGLDMAQSGYYKDARGRKVVDTTAADAAFKALGVQPKTVGEAQRVAGDVQQSISMARQIEAEIADKWARAIIAKDQAGVQKAVSELLTWNTNNPDWKIKITPAQIKARVTAALLTRDTRLLKSAPTEVRQSVFTTLSGG